MSHWKPDTRPIHKLIKRPELPEIGRTQTWEMACGLKPKGDSRAHTVWKEVNCKGCLARKSDLIRERRLKAKGWGTA